MTDLWFATITRIGPEAGAMVEAGCLILFGEPVPEALAEVSLVHDGTRVELELRAGDQFWLDQQRWIIEEVGERATANLAELGHVVVYLNQPNQKLLPGAIKAVGDAEPQPAVGHLLRFARD